ncbi:Outer-arm dynein beta, partial [Giardia muris]
MSGLNLEEIFREEEKVLCRALRDSNIPKIVAEDTEIFLGLIGDLFPSVDVPRLQDKNFEALIKKSLIEQRLQPEDSYILKIVQFEELLQIRHSVFILGSAAVGKTKCWNTLAETYKLQGKKIQYQVISPKSITTRELYGYIHPASREWKDGIFSTIMRDLVAIPNQEPKWIVLDGDIDALWVESLNTVMDDNKILTLASNERIPLMPYMRLVFEIGDLKYASPATVSRAGIIYINESDVGWLAYSASWVEKRESSLERSTLTVLFEKYLPPVLEAMKKVLKSVTPICDMSIVQTVCRLMDALMEEYYASPACKVNLANAQLIQQAQAGGSSGEGKVVDYLKDVIEYFFIFAVVWAAGGVMFKDQLVDHRRQFSKFWRSEFSKGLVFPTTGEVFDYYVAVNDETGEPRWQTWDDRLTPYVHDPELLASQVHVETTETYRLHYMLERLVKNGHPVLFCGPAGSGKTSLLKSMVASLNDLEYGSASIALNYYTTSMLLQSIMESYLEKKVGRRYGPVGNRKLIYIIDDLNMPQVDTYGTQQPLTLIRLHRDYLFWFDREKLTIKEITNCQYLASMNPYSGSFSVDPRLQWHFSAFSVDFPSEENLKHIYGSLLRGHFAREEAGFPAQVARCWEGITNALLKIHGKVTATFLPTAVKFHYVFNLRDLTNITEGIMRSTKETVKTAPQMVQLLIHECARVYCDRMVTMDDKEAYAKLIEEVVLADLQTINPPRDTTSAGGDDAGASRGGTRPKTQGGGIMAAQPITIKPEEIFVKSNDDPLPIIFSNFAMGIGDGRYGQIPDYDKLYPLLKDALDNHNETNAVMDLVLFRDAMEHVCRISRIITTGDALLVGVGGSGKQSLAKLAAFINGYEVFQITISSTYDVPDFREDLKKLYLKAGLKGTQTVFLFTDTQIVNEEFCVYINDLLSSGNICGLFPPDEEENIINGIRSEAKSAGCPETRESLYNYFIQKVKQNLHVVLGFSPIGEAFRVRARKFPALVTCTTIDWFQAWPHEALVSVGRRFLGELEMSEDIQNNVALFMADANGLVDQMSIAYDQIERRKAYTTPKSFLELISLYMKLLRDRRQEISDQIDRLDQGNIKLEQTEKDVAELQEALVKQQVIVDERKKAAEDLMAVVEKDTAFVKERKAEADIEAEKTAEVERQVSAKDEEARHELAKAEPAIIAAEAALNTLNKNNLVELRSFASPSAEIVNVMGAVMCLLEAPGKLPKDRSWKAAKNVMGSIDTFLNRLRSYDKDHIHETNFAAAKKYTSDPNFTGDFIKSKSVAAAGICEWARNIVAYNEIYKIVLPLREAAEEAGQQLEAARKKYRTVMDGVDKLNKKLQALTDQYQK